MATFEVSAHMTVRPGQLEGFKKQAAECIRITREQDTHTLRYDWFLSSDGECEVREAYTGPEGLIEHNRNILAARMTPAQVAEAQRLAREWEAAHPSPPRDRLAE